VDRHPRPSGFPIIPSEAKDLSPRQARALGVVRPKNETKK
jgi:hypothetical protein